MPWADVYIVCIQRPGRSHATSPRRHGARRRYTYTTRTMGPNTDARKQTTKTQKHTKRYRTSSHDRLSHTHSLVSVYLPGGEATRCNQTRAPQTHDAHLAPMPSTPSRSYVRPVWRILSSGADCTCKQQPIRRRHRWACSGRSAPSFQPCAAVARRRSHACHQERIIAALTAHGPPPPFASPPAQIVVRHAAHISPEQRGIGKLSSTDHAHPSHPASPASCHQPPPCCAPPRAR